ncbi:MAG TPA: hypothetical protein P5234_15495 [Thermoanaerobaculaceae bacterium]|nr:hypothetical protein [Thermoanaerobaculaceae bacterium]HRS17640.1 hypothetical protein [Thermoanaerobaculaceae bacterium]
MDVEVVVVPQCVTPIALAAVVEEEDTYLVLSAEPRVRETGESLGSALAAVRRAHPLPPGSVAMRRGKPVRLLAVVHDLSCTPSWREAWIAAALGGCLRIARRLRLGSLSLPLLGAVHGRFDPERFVSLLRDALAAAEPSALERLWLRAPDEQVSPIGDLVRALFPPALP